MRWRSWCWPARSAVADGAAPSPGTPADGKGPRVVIGGRAYVKPFVESPTKISLEPGQLSLTVEGVDKNFIAVSVKASVLFKARGDIDGVATLGTSPAAAVNGASTAGKSPAGSSDH